MPHVDELLGPATFAAAGLVVAIALQPPVAMNAPASRPPVTTTAASAAGPGTVVRLPSVDVVARRSTAVAELGRDARSRGAAKPRA